MEDINKEKCGSWYADCWFESAIAWHYLKKLTKISCVDIQFQGYEILGTWAHYSIVAACVLDQRVPFKRIRLNSLLLTPERKKFSKSSGHSLDVFSLIETYGIDACRLWIASLKSDADMIFVENELIYCKKAVRKIYSIIKFYESKKAGGLKAKA